MRTPRPRPGRPRRLRLPRRTARLRLTVLYGGACSWPAARPCSPLPTCSTACSGTLTPPVLHLRKQGKLVPGAAVPPAERGDPRGGSRAARPGQAQLLIASAIALAVIAVAAAAIGWLIAGRVLRPLRTITAAARRISASSLHERLALHGPDDELKELADTLDGLFARLEASFDAQRRFAANASHELRTPLTRERTLLQVTLRRPGRHHRHLAGRQPGTARLQRRAGTPHRGAAHPGQQRSRPRRARARRPGRHHQRRPGRRPPRDQPPGPARPGRHPARRPRRRPPPGPAAGRQPDRQRRPAQHPRRGHPDRHQDQPRRRRPVGDQLRAGHPARRGRPPVPALPAARPAPRPPRRRPRPRPVHRPRHRHRPRRHHHRATPARRRPGHRRHLPPARELTGLAHIPRPRHHSLMRRAVSPRANSSYRRPRVASRRRSSRAMKHVATRSPKNIKNPSSRTKLACQ